jgi:hypothetical protein
VTERIAATLKYFGNQVLGFRVKLGTTSAKAKKIQVNAFFANLLM